jgi:hypothetical protein
MTTRLAAVLLLSTAACLSGTGADLGLDDLPSYDQDTGGGKGDDPSCTDVAYREFIQGYMRGDQAAEANPCTFGNDASYRIWAYVAGEQLEPMFDAYGAAQTKRFNSQLGREQTAAAGTLDQATMAMLTKLEAIRPAHAGKVGVGAWVEYLYKPALDRATQPVGTNAGTPDSRDQWSNEVTTFEEEWLGFAERTQPASTEPHAYTIWWGAAGPKYTGATAAIANTLAEQAAVNTAFVARLGTTKPAGTFDEDGATFQTELTTKMAASYAAITPTPAAFQGALALKPSGGGPMSYKTWASAFASIAVEYNARTRGDAQRELFTQIIALRPCGAGPDVDTVVGHLTTGLASAGNGPDGTTTLSQLSVPTACAQ